MLTKSKGIAVAQALLRSLVWRFTAVTLSLALCMGLVPKVSWAQESIVPAGSPQTISAEAAGEVGLTIVFGLGRDGSPDVVVHKSYTFPTGATLKDLLDAAVASKDIISYKLDAGGNLESVTNNGGTTLENASNFTTYWASYLGGEYYGGAESAATLTLEDGMTYQFAWESFPIAQAPDWSTLMKPDGSGKEEPDPEPTPAPLAYSQERFKALFTNIAAFFEGTAEEWKALDLAAIGRPDSVDREAIVANAIAAFKNPEATNLQKSIIALTALGVDASKVVSNGQNYNLIEALAQTPQAYNSLNAKMFTLLAYVCGPYSVPEHALVDESTLINDILALQLASGGFALSGSTSDADMTAIAIAALAPYRTTDAQVEAALEKALSALRELQLPDGGFAALDSPTALNTNATAMAILALAAVGIDAQTWIASSAGASTESNATTTTSTSEATPLTALLSIANDSNTAFMYKGRQDNLATEQAFRALVAYQGFKNTGTAYNIYTQAVQGIAGLGEALDPTENQVNESALGVLVETGDENQSRTIALSALVLGSLTTMLLLRRKRAANRAFKS